MNKEQFENLLSTIVTKTVTLIMKKNNWNEEKAIYRFVTSKVYSLLEQEETKVWHLSAWLLAALFEDERAGNLVWPQVF